MKRKGGWCEGVGARTRPSSEAERNAVTEVERRTCAYRARGRSSRRGKRVVGGRHRTWKWKKPEDDGVCRLAASLMQHDAILMLMRRTYASAGGLENWEEVPETIHAFRVIAIVEEILQNRIEA